MKKTFGDLLKLLLPLSRANREGLKEVSRYVDEAGEVRRLVKMGYIGIEFPTMGSETLGMQEEYPRLVAKEQDEELEGLVIDWNNVIQKKVNEVVYNNFSIMAENGIKNIIAPNILGLEKVKEAVMLQLFANERVHILLLGDPGTGKTDILRSAADMAPLSSFGLGSGTSGAGLTVTMQGKDMIKGLLPLAHRGLCCIDELNLMKDQDRAGLLNAMEKGFVSYDKADQHLQVDADVKVLATANPKGDQFAGWMVETLKKQLPFDPALLTRFHLVFLIKRPDVEGFKKIAEKIVKDEDRPDVPDSDEEFVKGYIEHASKLDVKFDKKLEEVITGFVEEVKQDEDKFLVDISPRLVVGIIRLSKASARLNMRKKVERKDVLRVIDLVRSSLEIKEKN